MENAADVFDGRDVSQANLGAIRASYASHGFVCVRMLTQEQCNELVLEQWRRVILCQEWTTEYKIVVHGEDGRVLDPNRPDDQREFLAAVVGPLSAARRKQFEAGWPLHRGFGACCDPAVFHLESVWKIRQDPDLYKIASDICNETHLWTTLDRSIQKLPGQGDNVFLHFDFNPFDNVRRRGGAEEKDSTVAGLRGKISYTPSRFVCVPGTHTDAFLLDFVDKYAQHYPNVKPKDTKFAISKDKPDPLNLVSRKRAVHIPSGCLIFWHPRLLHGQMKTSLNDPVEYGSYIGFLPARSRARYQGVCGVDELQDRLRSYREGQAPILWPSLDKIHFYPNKFNNFPRLMNAYIEKLPPKHPMLASRVSASGTTVTYLKPLAQPNYLPPPLTKLGKQLLGIDGWVSGAQEQGGGGGGEERGGGCVVADAGDGAYDNDKDQGIVYLSEGEGRGGGHRGDGKKRQKQGANVKRRRCESTGEVDSPLEEGERGGEWGGLSCSEGRGDLGEGEGKGGGASKTLKKVKNKVKVEADPPLVANAPNRDVFETETACEVSRPASAEDKRNPPPGEDKSAAHCKKKKEKEDKEKVEPSASNRRSTAAGNGLFDFSPLRAVFGGGASRSK